MAIKTKTIEMLFSWFTLGILTCDRMGIEIIVELASSDQENYFQNHHVGCNFQPQRVLPNFLTCVLRFYSHHV